MGSFRSKVLIYALVAALSISGTLLSGSSVSAGCDTEYLQGDPPNGGLMLVDAVVVRPLTFIASIAGTAIWVVTLPFSLLGGNMHEAGEILVADPWCYTFARPLGYMEEVP